jgi:hypothetical protein
MIAAARKPWKEIAAAVREEVVEGLSDTRIEAAGGDG